MVLNVSAIAAQFDVAEAMSITWPLLTLILGIFIYGIFVFKFYRFLARKNIIDLDLRQYNYAMNPLVKKLWAMILYAVEYLVVFPVLIMFWFLVLSLFIGLISERGIQEVYLISMALVAATRLAAYYKEDLSRDLAKMIPFALLGIYLIDIRLLSFGNVTTILQSMLDSWRALIYYLLVAVALEFIWRIFSPIFNIWRAPTPPEEEDL